MAAKWLSTRVTFDRNRGEGGNGIQTQTPFVPRHPSPTITKDLTRIQETDRFGHVTACHVLTILV